VSSEAGPFPDGKPRCGWCNPKNPAYVAYHDGEWGRLDRTDDAYLFEMLALESFQAGLSWECILNKRADFREAYDGFDWRKIAGYDAEKCAALAQDARLVRNRSKIAATVGNARVFESIRREFGGFHPYLCAFTHGRVFTETGRATSPLSDALSADLRKRGMKYAGSVIVYSYLQAIGIVRSHDASCWLHESET